MLGNQDRAMITRVRLLMATAEYNCQVYNNATGHPDIKTWQRLQGYCQGLMHRTTAKGISNGGTLKCLTCAIQVYVRQLPFDINSQVCLFITLDLAARMARGTSN